MVLKGGLGGDVVLKVDWGEMWYLKRKGGVWGKCIDLGGRRGSKKKKGGARGFRHTPQATDPLT